MTLDLVSNLLMVWSTASLEGRAPIIARSLPALREVALQLGEAIEAGPSYSSRVGCHYQRPDSTGDRGTSEFYGQGAWTSTLLTSPHSSQAGQGDDKGTYSLRCVRLLDWTIPQWLSSCGAEAKPEIIEILLRFRVHRIAVVADIEKAFLMVSIAERDHDVLRFLWFKDACTNQRELMELRFTCIVFGISSSLFLLNATIRHHLNKYESSHPVLVERLCWSLYVDVGAANEEQAYQMFVTSKRILGDAGFNLRKFHSNWTLLQEQVNPEIYTYY